MILIIACIALGFTAAAVNSERTVATAEHHRAEMLASQCSVAQGQLEDLGKFLANPNTKLISLSASDGFQNSAVVAWNGPEEKGYFLCDDLPPRDPGNGYEIWALSQNEQPAKIATINARPGASVYPFRTPASKLGRIRLEVTAGPRTVQSSPVFSGEIE